MLINYFAPHCNGCRRLYPKFQQMVTCNPGVLFIKVRPAFKSGNLALGGRLQVANGALVMQVPIR